MAKRVVTILPTIDVLPFNEVMDWDRYQVFCTDVLAGKIGVQDCREYLLQGNAQEGIDIYAIGKERNRNIFVQCKLTAYLSPEKFTNAIDVFLAGKFAEENSEFILCTSFNLSRHRDEQAIENARMKLKQKNIELTIWDEQGICRYLRLHPNISIVYHYFKEDVTKAFYGGIWEQYINGLKAVAKKTYKWPEDYIDRKVIPYIEQQRKKNNFNWIFSENVEERDIIEIFETSGSYGKKIMLLSIAGYGKSMELNKLAAWNAVGNKPKHPVRYHLKDYQGQDIETLLNNYSTHWENLLPDNLLLLYDGLDEIKEQHHQTFINHLNAFLNNHQSVQVLVTSRFNFYDLRQQLLRDFDIYLLQPLSPDHIQKYISQKLEPAKNSFLKKLEKNKFSDYISNPYYLTRLVRFYREDQQRFPKNKSALFERILFEQLDRDESKFNKELKDKLLPLAKKLAFCMTLTGKSALTTDELKHIVPNNDDRKQLKHFCILNLNEATQGTWSFEHKNLQEYLCASAMMNMPFPTLHPMISFEFNPAKLLPRFLNTISFLFEIIEKHTTLFTELFDWILEHQPELFVRFEKEQIDKSSRQEIFKRILHYYKTRNITFRISPNFHVRELANFADIDGPLIDFLENELVGASNEPACDILQLLSTIERPYPYSTALTNIYFSVLKSANYPSYVKVQCISGLIATDPHNKRLFEQVLVSPIDINDFEIRRRLIGALENSSYYEDFTDFILESISIYKDYQKTTSSITTNDVLERLILKLSTAPSIKKVLSYCISHKNTIARGQRHGNLSFGYEHTKQLLEKAGILSKSEPTFVRLVYKLFLSDPFLSRDDEIAQMFRHFFDAACVTNLIFKQLYKSKARHREMLHFADEQCIDFLINEYLNGHLTDEDAILIRNRLSWKNEALKNYYLDKLNALTNNKFKEDEQRIDLKKLLQDYKEKNQLLLMNKALFQEETTKIFAALGKERIEHDDLYFTYEQELLPFQYSIVKEEIIGYCAQQEDQSISEDEFLKYFEDPDSWDNFVRNEIAEHLRNKKDIPLRIELIGLAQDWLISQIKAVDFSKAIWENEEGKQLYSTHIEFIKELYLLLDIDLDDQYILKLLEADFSYALPDNTLGVSEKISLQVKDKTLLKRRIFENIRSGKLHPSVLMTHFILCHKLRYQECLGELFKLISTGPTLSHYDKRKLTKCYLDLGGEVTDFSDFLRIPTFEREEDHYIQWEWLLLEKFVDIEPEKVSKILVDIYHDPNQNDKGKAYALKLLLRIRSMEGLLLWAHYIRAYHRSPFEWETDNFQNFFVSNATSKTVKILIDTLDYTFENKIFPTKPFESIQEFIYSSLILTAIDVNIYLLIRRECLSLQDKYSNEDFVQQITIFIERFDQRFYQNHEYEITINKAIEFYELIPRM